MHTLLQWLAIGVGVLSIIGLAKTFAKANQPWLAAFIPVYNIVVLLRLANRPAWWTVLFFIPVVNIVVVAMVCFDVARAFRRSPAYGWLLYLFGWIGFPVLGFGESQYHGDTSTRFGAEISSRSRDLGVALKSDYGVEQRRVAIGRGSNLSDHNVEQLVPLGLEEAYLSRTSLTDQSIQYFSQMTSLRILDLTAARLSREGVRQLKQALPNAVVYG